MTRHVVGEATPHASKGCHYAVRVWRSVRSRFEVLWWAEDLAGHGGSAFKVFTESKKGLQWFRDADKYGDFIIGKHKAETGQIIPLKELNGR